MRSSGRLVLAVLAVGAILIGCSGPDGSPECSGVEDPCTSPGTFRCSADGHGIEECAENAHGCLRWETWRSCGTHQACLDPDAPACECSDQCEDVGATSCDENVIVTCEVDAQDCMIEAFTQDCGGTGQTCEMTEGEARCSGCPEPPCRRGERRCRGAELIEVCAAGEDDGCLDWHAEEDCGDRDPPMVCLENGDDAGCSAPCEDRCAAGESRCNGSGNVESCERGDDGCLDWVETEVCGELEHCLESADGAACAECDDGCDTVAATRCAGDVIETCTADELGCLAWEAGDICRGPGEYCLELDGGAVCAPCDDACGPPGSTRCEADSVETCDVDAHGCLAWSVTDACDAARETCHETAEGASCGVCDDECEPVGSTRCDADVVETCAADERGCLVWVADVDCAGLDPVRRCFVIDGVPTCLERPPGDSCETPLAVLLPFEIAGEDFAADYTDDLDLEGDGCTSRAGSPEAVFVMDLTAGQTVIVRELGPIDVVMSLFRAPCDRSETCDFSADDGEVEGHRHTAEVDERVYVIVEASSPAPSPAAYEIHIDLVTMEVCDDALDNDFDGDFDCDDPECFGVAPCDEVELNCDDDADNDLDGATDCDDSDCREAPPCVEHECADEFDDDGDGLIDCEDPDCELDADCVVPLINEVAYDDAGSDDREFVELFTPIGGFDLSGYTLVHRDGSGGTVLWAIDLAGRSTDDDGYFVVGSTRIEGADAHWAEFRRPGGSAIPDTDATQNGPDSLVLYEDWDPGAATGTVIDAVAYEDFGHAGVPLGEGDPAAGLASGNWGSSIGRTPDGADTGDNRSDFPAAWWTTPGAPNTPGQPEGFVRLTGSTVPAEGTVPLPVAIPDASPDGIDLDMTAASTVGHTIIDVQIGVRVLHPDRSELVLTLTSPDDTTVTLHARGGPGEADLTTAPAEGTLDSFDGENSIGSWTLGVSDHVEGGTGQVFEWVLWIRTSLPVM
jgi:subtilisin-like proprotein convertase family protein